MPQRTDDSYLAALISSSVETPVYNFNIGRNTNSLTLRTLLNNAGFNDNVPSIITLTVAAGVKIGGGRGLAYSFFTGSFPIRPTRHTITLIINGEINGLGGSGGMARGVSSGSGTGGRGSRGSRAMFIEVDCSIIVNSGGKIRGGGGGGGGGGAGHDRASFGQRLCSNVLRSGSNGQEGQGHQNLRTPDRNGGAFGQAGRNGRTVGDPTCDPGAPGYGGSGGASGAALYGRGYSISITNNGTIAGAILKD